MVNVTMLSVFAAQVLELPPTETTAAVEAVTDTAQEVHKAFIIGDTGISSMVETIGNLGIMVVIAAVVVAFLIRVLNTLLDQTRQSTTTIVPKLNDIPYSINQMKTAIAEQISAHNISSNKQLSSIDLRLDHISSSLGRIDRELDQLQMNQQDIALQLEKIEGMIYVIQSYIGIKTDPNYFRSKRQLRMSDNSESEETKNDTVDENKESGES